MKTGYPRFFIHLIIQELEEAILKRYNRNDQKVMLFPSRATASRCHRFLLDKAPSLKAEHVTIMSLVVRTPHANASAEIQHVLPSLFCVFFPHQYFDLAKQVWQHSGDGISSRRAEFCLEALQEGLLYREDEKIGPRCQSLRSCRGPRRYQGTRFQNSIEGSSNSPSDSSSSSSEEIPIRRRKEYSQFVEERFGRNLNAIFASKAKLAIRRRIAGCLVEDTKVDRALAAPAQNSGRISGLTEAQVYLYPSGMSSIFNTYNVLLQHRKEKRKSICFGFPYIDTLKILEKWGPGCIFYGHGSGSDLDDLENRLKRGERYLALFTEFPSNPLLNSPDLQRIRSLADRYDFAVVVDETIGNFINVNTLSLADVVVSSLTKIFSGDSNVMGGSAVYNPCQPRYAELERTLSLEYEDNYWAEDAVFMERNSRDFVSRIERINGNAETISDLLNSSPVPKAVYYPKYRPSKAEYDQCRNIGGGYGGLLSVTFPRTEDAIIFFDELRVAKGPSLGTNFTLACPFVLLAHYRELDWVAQYGVDASLVRISVGLEPRTELTAAILDALKAVERNRLDRPTKLSGSDS